jgi:uncharacterized protein involved in type VI secretion and phage assembly
MSNSKSETPAQPSKDSDDVPRELELTVYEYSFTRQWLKFIDEVNKKPRKAIAGPDQKSEEAQESTGPQQTEGTANTKEDQEEADPRSVNGEGDDRNMRAERGPRATWGLAIVSTAGAGSQSDNDGFEGGSDQIIIARNEMNQNMQQGVLPSASSGWE